MTTAKKGNTVRIHYTGKLKNNKIFESTITNGPIEFTIGNGQAIPGLEENIIGMKVDEIKKIDISPTKGYGKVEKNLIFEVNRKEIFEDVELKVGQQLEIPQDDDRIIVVSVKKITDETVILDGNHPLAGKDLVFDVQLLEIVN